MATARVLIGNVRGPAGRDGTDGATGPTGPQGPQGIQGENGPNTVSNTTSTALTGVLYGNGEYVSSKTLGGANGVASLDANSQIPVSQIPSLSYVPTSEKGLANGVASLDGSGKLPHAQGGRVNRNLLDNWYFPRPVNQRGATSYTAAGYTIDRWKKVNAHGSVSVASQGLALTGDSAACDLIEYIENGPSLLNGKTLTLSGLLSDGTLVSTSAVVTFSGSEVTTKLYRPYTNGGIWLQGNQSEAHVFFRANAGATVTVRAVKLELGDSQTLAHNEGTESSPVWVLNEIPDYATELHKCQRFQLVLAPSTHAPYATGMCYSSGARFFVPTPATMRAIPGIVFLSGDVSHIRVASNGSTFTPTALRSTILNGSGVNLIADFSGGTAFQTAALFNEAAETTILLDANIDIS